MAGLFVNYLATHTRTMSRLITMVDPRGFEPLTPWSNLALRGEASH
jgi:hypothetical protein